MKCKIVTCLFMFFCLVLLGCQDNASVNPTTDTHLSQLIGPWQWFKSVGGFAPTVLTPQSTGQTVKIIFLANGIHQYFRNDTLVNQLSYVIKKDTSVSPPSYLIHYGSTDYSPDQVIGYGGADTLYLIDNCADCFRHSYVRAKK